MPDPAVPKNKKAFDSKKRICATYAYNVPSGALQIQEWGKIRFALKYKLFSISGVHQVKDLVKDTNKSFCLFGMGVVLI